MEVVAKYHDQDTGKYNRERELRRFDDSKAGVKGLVDAGVTQIPRIFIHSDHEPSNVETGLIPVIDLKGGVREKIAGLIGVVCEEYGLFQVVNHGISTQLLDDVLQGVRGFHEADVEVKEYYSRNFESRKNAYYYSNHDMFHAKDVYWRDTLCFIRAASPSNTNAQELPPICR